MDARIKCVDVTSLSVSVGGTHATIFGNAEHNGMMTRYRIDVADFGEPAAGQLAPPGDSFTIQTDSAYIAGGDIARGNIQVHKQ